jgi:hypothetical protein
MPSVSKKQHNFMEAIAHSPSFAKKVGVKQSVGKDFAAADKGKKFKEGGMATKMSSKMMAFEKSGKDVEKKGMREGSKADMALDKKQMAGMKKGGMTKKMAGGGMTASKMGAVKTAAPSRDGVAQKGKTVGKNLGDSGKNVGIMSGAKGMKKGGMSKMKKGGYC